MKDYSKMSDTEVANKVLEVMGFKHNQSGYGFDVYLSTESRKDTGPKASKGFMFDPCNNPSDAWPFITGSRISLLATYRGGDVYTASAGDDGEICFEHKNPLRAAMIVYLMMKDAE